ncbi:hypothetical protein B0I35DRAFT_414232 [Stachybotrys elegans]|uniref:Uncharacterized protein n=1 Tax=Stachybotrys elegans TaxID=80388 RepID=A0A8K0SFL0_9HYPO|nr:hypothetical protein B0I35DRAFT_414232 [Stachybotrys elegans]
MRAPQDAIGTAEKLRQSQNTSTRSEAIVTFCNALRFGDQFQPFWDAIGGAAALAALMVDFSLRDVQSICRGLAKTACAETARPARRAALEELLQILQGSRSADGQPLDPRPLRQVYQKFVPACNWDVVQQWEEKYKVEWTASFISFSLNKKLLRGNIAMSKLILERLIEKEDNSVELPRDLMDVVIMPMMKRLFRRTSYGNDMRDEYLELVAKFIRVHDVKSTYDYRWDRETLLSYAIRRWLGARDDRIATSSTTKQRTESTLKELIALIPSRGKAWPHRLALTVGGTVCNRRKHVCSYQLLRLVLQHAVDYKLDIDDDSSWGLARLRDLTDRGELWPPRLFFHLDIEDGLRLFERLSSADPTGGFLGEDYGGLMYNRQEPERPGGDVAIFRTLLLYKAAKEPAKSEWTSRARKLVQERKKKAQESREPHGRAFWGKSALNLTIAIGDLELLDDVVVWARRFNNDGFFLHEFYAAKPFNSEELCNLLSLVPEKNEGQEIAYTDDDAQRVRKDILVSHRIIVHLMETIVELLTRPNVKSSVPFPVFTLVKMVVDHRTKKENARAFHALFDSVEPNLAYTMSPTVESLWKPLLEILLDISVLMESLLNVSSLRAGPFNVFSLRTSPFNVFESLEASGQMKADLADFLMNRMKAKLSPEALKNSMHSIVSIIGQYRQLLNHKFLTALKPSAVRDFLHMLADAMKTQMQKQALRPMEEVDKDGNVVLRPSLIKVTTVKMMAQILLGTQLISAQSACDILLALLAEARHIDIRVALVDSLLSVVKEPPTAPDTQDEILGAIETHIGPVLAQLNERRPVTEDEWIAAAGDGGRMPDIGEQTPLILLLIDFATSTESPAEARERLINLLVRVPAESAAINDRWNKLFLAKHGFTLDPGEELPIFPVSSRVYSKLFPSFMSHMPASVITMLRKMALVNLAPTPGIARVTSAIKADAYLINSNAGKHWLAQFDNPGAKVFDLCKVTMAAWYLQTSPEQYPSKRKDGQGISVPMLQEFILAVADQLIISQYTAVFEVLVTNLSATHFHGREFWQGIRLGLLPIPSSAESKYLATDLEWKTFVLELLKLLGWLAERKDVPYHEDFAQLKTDLGNRVKPVDCARVALMLGSYGLVAGEDNEPTLVDYLRLDLAGNLLLRMPKVDTENVDKEIQEMVDSWANSEDDFICTIGHSAQQLYKK